MQLLSPSKMLLLSPCKMLLTRLLKYSVQISHGQSNRALAGGGTFFTHGDCVNTAVKRNAHVRDFRKAP